MHLKLYAGYVKQVNALTDEIAGLTRDGSLESKDLPAYSELKRRLGYEYNGMVLHELYFDNLKGGSTRDPPAGSRFEQAAVSTFGKYIEAFFSNVNWLAADRRLAPATGDLAARREQS